SSPGDASGRHVSGGFLGAGGWPRLAVRAVAGVVCCWPCLRLHPDTSQPPVGAAVSPSRSVRRVAEWATGRTAQWPRKSIDRPSPVTAAGLAAAPGFRAASAGVTFVIRLARAATLCRFPVPVAETAAAVVTPLLPTSAEPSSALFSPCPSPVWHGDPAAG